MALPRQAKALSNLQINTASDYILHRKRNGLRNQTIFLCSVFAGMRACEISALDWDMMTDAEGRLGNEIRLPNIAAKGRTSGRVIPMHSRLRHNLVRLGVRRSGPVFVTEQNKRLKAHSIVKLFRHWYGELQFHQCSSHSGRRSFITAAARSVGKHQCSLRDVQKLAGHSSLAQTEAYIETNERGQRDMIEDMFGSG